MKTNTAVYGTKDAAGGAPKGEDGKLSLTPEALQQMIATSVAEGFKSMKLPEGQKIDIEAMTKGIAAGVIEQTKAAKTEVKAFDFSTLPELIGGAVKSAIESIKLPGKMVHGGEGGDPAIDFPISHRAGNLTVGSKQLLNVCTRKGMNEGISDGQLSDANKRGSAILARMQKMAQLGINLKGIVTSGSPGSNFVNTDLSSDLLQRFYMNTELGSALLAQEIPMPSDPYKLPISTTRPVFTIGGQTSAPYTALAPTNPGSAQVTLQTTKLIAQAFFSYEQDEDTIIPILPWLQNQFSIAAVETFESAVINGDVTSTHQDSDVTGGTDARKSWNGLRKLALGNTGTKIDLSTGGVSVANLVALRKLLKKWGVRTKDLLWVVGPSVYNDLVGLAETLRVQDAGQAQARLLTGDAPQIFGIPIIQSEAMREDLNASGVYDGTTTTKKGLILFNKSYWLVGAKRDFFMETDKDIANQQNILVGSFRRAFQAVEAPTNALPFLAYGYNLP